MQKSYLWISAVALAAVACAAPGKVDKPRGQMTQREKDSILSESRLPGAGVVKKAMDRADKENIRQAMMDSITDNQ